MGLPAPVGWVCRQPAIYTATLAFSAWWTWALLTFLMLGYVLKAVDEERFLGAHLAAAYDDYRRRVPYRLLPVFGECARARRAPDSEALDRDEAQLSEGAADQARSQGRVVL